MKNITLVSVLIILSIIFSTKIWEFIKLDGNDIQILGEYYENKHNGLNDPLRYVIFVFIPVFTFSLYKFFIEKSSLSLASLKLNLNEYRKKINILFYLNLIIIFFLFLEFLSINFPLHLLDIFHEGQKLTAPYKSLLDGKLWAGSYVTTGIINENLGIKFFWNIVKNPSIGSMRYVQILYVLFLKLSLVILIYQISKQIYLSTKSKILFYLILIFISHYLIDYNLGSGDNISYRDLPVILCLIFFIEFLLRNNNFILLVLISFLAVTSFFWSIDRAITVNLFIVFIFIIFFLNKRFRDIYFTLCSIIIFWLIFYLLLGDEFYYFIDNSISVLKNQNYIHGIIHPTPFSDMENSSRATKSLLSIILLLIITTNFLFSKKLAHQNNFKLIIFALTFLAFCSYMYALSRSDGGHIKQTTGILILTFSMLFSFYVLKYFDNFLIKKFQIFFLKSLISLTLIFLIISNFKIYFSNISNYTERLKEYITLEDEYFLSKKQIYLIDNIKPLISNENCIQLFTYDAALPYLLKKINCSKYYFIYSLGSKKEQKEFISHLKNTNVIIYSGQTDEWGQTPQKKLHLVDDFIKSRYLRSIKISDWMIKLN